VQKSKCALTRRAANMNQPIENRTNQPTNQHSSSLCKGTL